MDVMQPVVLKNKSLILRKNQKISNCPIRSVNFVLWKTFSKLRFLNVVRTNTKLLTKVLLKGIQVVVLKIFKFEYQGKSYKDAIFGIFRLSRLRCGEPHATFLALVNFIKYLKKASVTLMNEMQSLVFEESSFVL